MKNSQYHHSNIVIIAKESVNVFRNISESAQKIMEEQNTSSQGTNLPYSNTWLSNSPAENIKRIMRENSNSYAFLAREPAISRIVAIDDLGKKHVYFICRVMPVNIKDKNYKLASYRSPIGQLAALNVGDEKSILIQNKEIHFTILERALFKPQLIENSWDSKPSTISGENYGELTVESLQALLTQNTEEVYIADSDEKILLGDLADPDYQSEKQIDEKNVRAGTRREIIREVGLRDQPVLDQWQDKIFRRPINSRLFICGAPGTGKTTTLIRRLGQKLDVQYLDENEKKIAGINDSQLRDKHLQNWIMFTPTELLRLYVKEAFNREDIPAPDERIITWVEFRNDLARNKFGILSSPTNDRSLIMKADVQTCNAEAISEQIAWFEDFDRWQQSNFLDLIKKNASKLTNDYSKDASIVSSRIHAILSSSGTSISPNLISSMTRISKNITSIMRDIEQQINNKIQKNLVYQIKENANFLPELENFFRKQGIEMGNDKQAQRSMALRQYYHAIRTLSMAEVKCQEVSMSSLPGRLIEWLGNRIAARQELLEIGNGLLVRSELGRLTNPVRQYIDGIPNRYLNFRKQRQTEGQWYFSDGFGSTDIHPLEVDLILLTMIRNTDTLYKNSPSLSNTDSGARTIFGRLEGLYRTQVLVDEATDFSPIQLSCMASLARSPAQSFFACGDFNQRVTNWGTRSVEQMRWSIPNIEISSISVIYRQSRQLWTLAQRIVQLSGGETDTAASKDYAENSGANPVLVTQMAEISAIANWLAKRIQEIERNVRQLPSIAVLVKNDEMLRSVAKALGEALSDQNTRVIACHDGQVRGSEAAVRVFDVQHIKGLEFEAVFFVGLDTLSKEYPDIFDKYLYVGATRAATYLGITCERELPHSLVDIEELFAKNWE